MHVIKTKKRAIVLALIVILLFMGFFCYLFKGTHTFTLTDDSSKDSYIKSEQIQPLFGTVKVWGTQDTDVCFTDVENPEIQYKIGYITPGLTETIKLEKGRWYYVEGAGEITVRMVNVRVQ